MRFRDADSSHYVGFKATTTVTSSVVWALPAADAEGCFKSNGSGSMVIESCGAVEYEYFNNTAGSTYTVPNNGTLIIVEAWGGGG